jgi:hypothetical protein
LPVIRKKSGSIDGIGVENQKVGDFSSQEYVSGKQAQGNASLYTIHTLPFQAMTSDFT